MLSGLPSYVIITFLLAAVLTCQLFISAVKNKSIPGIILFIWLTITAILSYTGFYAVTSIPPRFLLAVVPPLVFILLFVFSKKGKAFSGTLNLRTLTLLHIVRIPVELVLYWLAIHKYVPGLMTFEGRNFDIISGITAPLMYFVCFAGEQVKNRALLLIWNFICLGLLLNIVVNAALSVPSPVQQFAFNQPNIAVLHFPFVWLPAFIVMIVLYSHLVAIQRLQKKK